MLNIILSRGKAKLISSKFWNERRVVLSTFLFSVDLGASCTIRQEKEIKGLQTENEDDPAGKHIDLVKKNFQ